MAFKGDGRMSKEVIELTLREVIPDDATSLISFVNRTRRQTSFLSESEPLNCTVEEETTFLEKICKSENSLLILALNGTDLIGTVLIQGSANKRFQHVGDLAIAVDKDYWGLGIGSYLMKDALHWAKENPILRRIELKVMEENEHAIRLYQKFGFEEEAHMRQAIKVDNVYSTMLLMSKFV